MAEKENHEKKTGKIREWNKAVRRVLCELYGKVNHGKSEETPEEEFLREWKEILSERAEVFTGLYAGMASVEAGKARRPAKVFREWRVRTRYQWEGQEIQIITEQCLSALDENSSSEEYRKWAGLLLQAANAAGIKKDVAGTLVLDERTINAYTEWDGNELYIEDTVEVLTPAWYRNGKVIEQGQCRKQEET